MKYLTFAVISIAALTIGFLLLQSCGKVDHDVSSNHYPTCSITNPSFGEEISMGEMVTISVKAEDEDNNLKVVRFYADEAKIGSASSFPYHYEWKTDDISKGSHTIKALAIDELDITVVSSTFTDPRDGQTYKIVEIGDQVWMAENLNYEMDQSWRYDNEPENGETYGRLYTWDAAIQACPEGWHLPSDEEWKELIEYIGGSKNAGYLLKSTNGWNDKGNGNDEFGFKALPGGHRGSGGEFSYLGYYAHWWTATEDGSSYGGCRNIYYNNTCIKRFSNGKGYSFSVRCLKD